MSRIGAFLRQIGLVEPEKAEKREQQGFEPPATNYER